MSENVTDQLPPSVQKMLQDAQAAAAILAAQQAQNVGAVSGGTSLAPVTPGRTMTAEDLMTGDMSVDTWLKVKDTGIYIGQSKSALEELVVEIDMSRIGWCMCIKGGNPAVYKKTYDQVTTIGSTKSWEASIAELQRIDARARPYRSADIVMLPVNDVMDPKKPKEVLVEADKKVGHSLSTTNWGNFRAFYDEVKAKGLQASVVKVRLGYESRSKPGVNDWGVLTFEHVVEN